MRERDYQAGLILRIEERFPGCMVLKNDPGYLQGIPDLIVLHGIRWAALEVKVSATAPFQPNQPYYIEKMGELSFASIIYPENEEAVLDALQRAFESGREARLSRG